jgi:hypothetical protein
MAWGEEEEWGAEVGEWGGGGEVVMFVIRRCGHVYGYWLSKELFSSEKLCSDSEYTTRQARSSRLRSCVQ